MRTKPTQEQSIKLRRRSIQARASKLKTLIHHHHKPKQRYHQQYRPTRQQGLGTSTAKEAKEYFAALDTHQLEFEWKEDDRDNDLIDMAFSKKRGTVGDHTIREE